MTFCAGWTYGNSAFLTSDSAITYGPRRSTISSFGEKQGSAILAPVEESTLKIGRVGPGIAVAYCRAKRRAQAERNDSL
jgi:hypothetical protein